MIQPEFLAQLRHRLRAEMVLVLVQLEQLCPLFAADLNDLAIRLGTDRSTLNRSLRRLEKIDLIRRVSISNGGGTWLWWVARYEGDKPVPEREPSYVLRDVRKRLTHRVPITQRWEWARRHNIPRATMRNFLMGYQLIMRDRWELVATPHDEVTA